jgi:hypothetical protein
LQNGRRRYESWTWSPTTTDEDEDLPSSVPCHLKTQCPLTAALRALGSPLPWRPSLVGLLRTPSHSLDANTLSLKKAYTWSFLALAAEHSAEEPDAGAQEGSGDDYEG